MIKEHNQLVTLVVGVLDLAVTAGAWVLSYYIRFHTNLLPPPSGPAPPLEVYLANSLLVTLLLTLLVFGWLGLYRARRVQPFGVEVWDLLRACGLVWALGVVAGHFLVQPRISIAMQGVFLLAWPTLMIAYRGSARAVLRWFRGRGMNIRTAAVVGCGRLGQKLVHTLRRERWTGYRVSYFVDDTRTGESLLGIPVRGPLGDLRATLTESPVDVVFVALPSRRAPQLAEVLAQLAELTIDVQVVPDLLSYQFLGHQVQQVGPLPLIHLTSSPQAGLGATAKRAFDMIGSAVMLVLLSPVMLAAAVAVKLSSRGPVLYRQRRASLGGEEFDIYKFRSMRLEDGDGKWSTDPADPRITAVGRFLRKWELDELPQLLNVLLGDMSLVGPRPEQPAFIERFNKQVPRYALRHHVKGGMTGWAQVNGYRGRTSLRKRIQYDLDYITRWSMAFDLYILLLTLVGLFYRRRR